MEYVHNEYLYEEKTSEQGASYDKCQLNLKALMSSNVSLFWVSERKPQIEF